MFGRKPQEPLTIAGQPIPAGSRELRRALRGLDRGARRRIRAAVRRGVAVDDPREAAVAVGVARNLSRVGGRMRRFRAVGWLFAVLELALAIPVVLIVVRAIRAGDPAALLDSLLPLVPLSALVATHVLTARLYRRAAAAAEANARLLRDFYGDRDDAASSRVGASDDR